MTTAREIKYLRQQRTRCRYISDLLDIFYDSQGCLCLVFEYMPYDLAGIIGNAQVLWGAQREAGIKWYLKQALMGLEFLHSRSILHRDIKG